MNPGCVTLEPRAPSSVDMASRWVSAGNDKGGRVLRPACVSNTRTPVPAFSHPWLPRPLHDQPPGPPPSPSFLAEFHFPKPHPCAPVNSVHTYPLPTTTARADLLLDLPCDPAQRSPPPGSLPCPLPTASPKTHTHTHTHVSHTLRRQTHNSTRRSLT